MSRPIDVDDTSRCPTRCEGCDTLDGVTVATYRTPAGVLCWALCDACKAACTDPGLLSCSETREQVLAHCGHLGISADQAVAMEEPR